MEFGLSATARTGRLTGLLVDGGGDAAFKVTMTWRSSPAAEGGVEDPTEVGGPTETGRVAQAPEPVERSQTSQE